MTAALTRKQRKAQTRHKLLASAARVFSRCGLHQASIDEVAQDAGFTKGAFYANFASKEELFLAMLDERFAERRRQIERIAAPGEDIDAQAREAGDEFTSSLAADPEWQRLFFEFAAHAGRDERFRAALLERYRPLREALEGIYERRGEELGGAPPVSPDQAAVMTFAMANGIALERLLEPDAIPDEMFGTMLTIFFAGLRALSAVPQGGSGTSPAPPRPV